MEGQSYLSINKWAEEDRPREKLSLKGKSALSDAELIGILLGSGTKTLSAVDLAKQILNLASNDLHQLAKLTIHDFTKIKGIGPAKAITIISALELGRRRKNVEVIHKPKVTCSKDAYDYLQSEFTDKQHEEFWILLLKRSNEIITKHQVGKGGLSGTVADPKVIFKKALDHNASGIILAHNHPSGNLKPSEADMRLTKKIKAAGEMLEITVLDHIIFTDHAYFSFSDESLMT